MSGTSVGQVIFAVGRAAEQLCGEACETYRKDSISANELRQFVRGVLDQEDTWNCRRFWKPLRSEEKTKALTKAIPDGNYPEAWEQSPS